MADLISRLCLSLYIVLYHTLWVGLFSVLPASVHSKTASEDVSALNVMFTSLNSPSKLSNWKSSGGDPCGDSWEGIECQGSSVTKIILSGLELSGQLGYKLSSLKSVTEFDLSENKLKDDIPYQLPPNLVYIDFSGNSFSGNVPYSLSQMPSLKKINLGHNKLSGQLSDMFGKLTKLTYIDLSFNKLTGHLPGSLANLSSLNTLNLQDNQFTGPINVLAYLPLNDLNVENNKFTGWIPNELKEIDNLQTDGNSWSSGQAPPPPPGFHPPTRHKSTEEGQDGKSYVVKGLTIAGIVVAALVAIFLVIALCTRRRSAPSSHFMDEEMNGHHTSFTLSGSQESSCDERADLHKDAKGHTLSDSFSSIDIKDLQKSPSIGFKPSLSDRIQAFTEKELTRRMSARGSSSFRAICYSWRDLQAATGNFAKDSLLGKGSIGRVYRAKYSDEKVFAVKEIDTSFFQPEKPEEFSHIVTSISKLHHANIAELIGYCSEQRHNLLIYEYFMNGSLHEFLHISDDFGRPLTWNTRVKIALGTARAVEYLHEVCSPSIVHKNIKSSNILLDIQLNPHLSDCGLATFYQRTSQNLGAGYNAPECTKPSAYTLKSDVYSFGVVMMELLTGRKPIDSSKPKFEQCLVQWASPRLPDIDALRIMVDPALCGLYPPKALSRFADVIALCVQREPNLRPPISEVVQALLRLD